MPRADAQLNRDRLLAAARAAFAREDSPSLEAIARDAGVGIGTLYRHFPRREALVEAVYRDQVTLLVTGAASLLAAHPGVEALRAWMDLFAEWAAAKRGMVAALATLRSSGAMDVEANRAEIATVIASLLDAGVADGSIRPGVDAADLRAMLAGILATAADAEQAGRLFDLVIAGLRP